MKAKIALASLALAFTSCTSTVHKAPTTEQGIFTSKIDSLERLAIVTAYEPEIKVMLPRVTDPVEYKVNGVTFWTGTIQGQPVVLTMTGISVVNAAMNTQLLLDKFEVKDILVSGVAGGVNPNLQIGDVTVPANWGQYDETVYMRETSPGEFSPPPDVTRQFEAYDFMLPRGTRIRSEGDEKPDRKFWYAADSKLLEIAKTANSNVKLKQCDEIRDACLEKSPKVIIGGNGVTGAIYMDNAKFREYLYSTFDAHVLEMETAAIAMVAKANDKPYVAIRSLSDLAGGGDTGFNESVIFEDLASENFAIYLDSFLTAYVSAQTEKQ